MYNCNVNDVNIVVNTTMTLTKTFHRALYSYGVKRMF